MFNSKKIMYVLSFAAIMLVFSAISFSFPLGLSASEKDLMNNQADVERAESETVEEVLEYAPIPDPSTPPEKALSEGKMIYIKQVTRRPKGYKPAPSLPFNEEIVSNRIEPENNIPVTPSDNEAVSEKVYKDFSLIINELVTESVVQSVYSDKIKEIGDFPVKNRSGLYNAGFSLYSGKNLLKFSYSGASLLMAPADIASVSGKVYSNTILYEGIYPGIDLRYTVEEHRLKEDIIVKKYTGRSDFKFQLTVSNAVYQKMPEGEIHFFDSISGLPLFYMAKPFAVDNNGSRCDLVSVDISNEGLLRLAVDPQWLKKAAYPIIIDPTIYLFNSEGGGSGIKPFWNYTGMGLGGGWGVSVNTYNLNLILNKALFAIPGRGIPIGETVTYNTLDGRTGALGSGWRLAAESSVIEQGDGSIIYSQGDGSVHTFTPNGSGGYNAPPGIYLTLQKTGPGNFTITDKAFNVWTYQNNRPSQVVDRDSNTTTYVYDGIGRIWKLRDPSGREITYSYNPSGMMSSITNPVGRSYQFGYQSGRLATVIDPENNTFTFDYDTSGRLSAFTDPLGRVTSFTCGSDGKLQLYRDARTQGQDIFETRFTQASGSEVVTTVTDPGNITYTYYHNTSTGNLTRFQDMPGNTWTYVWTNNNLTSVTDAKGTTSYEYDSRGNVTKKTTTVDSNTANNIVETMAYSGKNELLEVVDGEGRKTSYKYDIRGNLLSTSNPELKESNGRKYDQYGNVVEYSPNLSGYQNPIRNGSMEKAGINGNLLANWTRIPGGATAALEGFQSHGNSALKLSSTTPVTEWFHQQVKGFATGDKITLRADVKLENVQGGGAAIKILSTGSSAQTITMCSGTGAIPLVATMQHDGAWGYSTVDVYIGMNNASGTAWFDGVQLHKVRSTDEHTLSAFNCVENGGFEFGEEDWSEEGCWNSESTAYITGDSWSGVKAAIISLCYPDWGRFYQYIPVYGGESRTMSGMVKTTGVTGKGAYLKVEYLNASYQLLSSVQSGYLTGSQDYTRVTFLANAPLGAKYARVSAYLDGTGMAYFDAIKLVPVNTEKYTYNAAGNYRMTSEDALGKKNMSAYDESIGTRLSFTDALNNTTYFTYDNLNRLTKVTDPLAKHSYYSYDSSSYLIETRDPMSSGGTDNNYRTQYTPNKINQLGTLTDPRNLSSFYTYDRSRRLVRIQFPNGQENNFTYDNANRLIRKTLDGGRHFNYTYDGANNLTRVTDQDNKSYTWDYDGAGRTKYSIDNFNYRLDYQWDRSGRIKSVSGNDTYYYDSSGRLSRVGGTTYNYDENGRLFQVKRSQFDYMLISYLPNGWCSRIQDVYGFNYNYYYYDNGNTYCTVSWMGTEYFTYDANGRLTSWNLNGNTENYQYDAAGNILTKGSRTFTYNNANQITNSGFTFDNNGNMTSDDSFTYTYNAENQLTRVNRVSDGSLA